MKKYLVSILTLSLAAGFSGSAQAEERMDEVVVTADRVAQSAKTVTRSVTVIDAEEIAKGNCGTLPELLQKQGFGIVGFGNDMTKAGISIRGMSANSLGGFSGSYASDIIILVDGRRAGTQNLGTIPLVGVERIEVLRGPAGVQYGSNGIGGVINIITKRGGDKLQVSVEAGAGSWSTARTEAAVSGKAGIVDASAGINWMTQGDNYDAGKGEFKNTKIHNRTNYVLNLGVTPFEQHRLGVTLLGSSLDHAGDRGGYEGNANWGMTSNDNFFEQESHSVDMLYEGGAKSVGLSWKARYFHAYDKYVSNYVDYDSLYEYPEKMNGTQAQLSWNYKSLTVTGGFDWTNDKTWANGKSSGYAGLDNTAWFAMAKYGIMDDLVVLSAGLRYDDFELKYDGDKHDKDKTTYSVGVAVNPLDWLTFRANYGTSFKMPTGLQVTGYSDGWSTYLGNAGLKPEEGKGWDVGVEIGYDGVRLGATYFQTDYDDKIATRIVSGSYDREYYNIDGTSKYRGIEANVSWDLGQTFGWDFVLKPYMTMTRMLEYEDADGDDIKYVRDLEMTYGIDFAMPSIGLQVDFNMVYLGKQHEDEWYPVGGYYYASRTATNGSDTTANLYVTQRLYDWGDGGRLSARFSVTNIGDVHYQPKLDYPAPGRTFYLGLKYEY